MACSISLTADMAGDGNECRSPMRHPLFKSTIAALMEEPPISIPIACRCIPHELATMLVQRAAEYAPVSSVRAPAREGAYDTQTRCPDMVIACNVGQPIKIVLKCLAEE